MTIEKFWIIKDGVVGTVHLSRDKKIVDFRKANASPDYPVVHFHSTDGFALKKTLPMINIVIDPNFSQGRVYINQCQVEIDGIESLPIRVRDTIPGNYWDNVLTEEQRIALEIVQEMQRKLHKENATNYYQKERDKIIDFMLSKDSLSREQRNWVRKFLRSEGRKCHQPVSGMIPARLKYYYKSKFSSSYYGYDLLSEIEIVKMWWN